MPENTDTYESRPTSPSLSPSNKVQNKAHDGELQAVIEAWAGLPGAAKKYILAIIREADGHPEG